MRKCKYNKMNKKIFVVNFILHALNKYRRNFYDIITQ